MAFKTSVYAVAVIVCTYVYNVYGSADVYYLEDYCEGNQRQIYVDDNGAVLYSQRGANYDNNIDCTLTFFTTAGQVLMLVSQGIDLEERFDCINLFNGQDTFLPAGTHCRDDPLRYLTTQRYLTIQMITDGGISYAGFRLTVSIYNNTGFLDQCDVNAFHCQSSRECVAMFQVCDNTVDCLYGEDENIPECYIGIWLYWTGGQVAGLIIGYVIFLIIVIAITIVVNRKCKK